MRARLLPLAALALSGCTDDPSRSRDLPPHLRRYVADVPPPLLPHASIATWLGTLRLLGWSVEPEGALTRGKGVTLTLHWQTMSPLPRGLAWTTRLVTAEGRELANLDAAGPLRDRASGVPALGPSAFAKGRSYADPISFVVPDGAPKAVFLRVGLTRDGRPVSPSNGLGDAEGRVTIARLETTEPVPDVPTLKVHKLTGPPPVVDGVLDDAAWARASSTGPFVDVTTGAESDTLPVGGAARITWDDEHLYLAFELRDEDLVGGTTAAEKRQQDPHVWEKECVEIMIDPDGDGDNVDYYEVQISTENLVFDSRFDRYNEPRGGPDGPFGHEDWSMRGVSAVRVRGTLDDPGDRDEGYTVEVAIPWTSFDKAHRAPPRPGDVWRMNFYAMKKGSGVAWSPIRGLGNFHRASRFGRVVWVD